MKKVKFFISIIIITMLTLSSCTVNIGTGQIEDPIRYVENKIYSDNPYIDINALYGNSRESKINIYVNAKISPDGFGSYAEAITTSTKNAMKNVNKKLGKLTVRIEYKLDGSKDNIGKISWSTGNYIFGTLYHTREDLYPSGLCTLSRLKKIYSEENAEELVYTTEEQTTKITTSPEQRSIAQAEAKRDEEKIEKFLKPELGEFTSNIFVDVNYTSESNNTVYISIYIRKTREKLDNFLKDVDGNTQKIITSINTILSEIGRPFGSLLISCYTTVNLLPIKYVRWQTKDFTTGELDLYLDEDAKKLDSTRECTLEEFIEYLKLFEESTTTQAASNVTNK